MVRTRDFVMIGIGVAAAGVIGIAGYAFIQGQDKQTALQNFAGTWKFVSVRHGDATESPGGGIQLELSNGRIIGGFPGGPQMELTATSKHKLEGTLNIFGVGEKAVRVPVALELAENKQELNLLMMASKVDTTTLPSELKSQFSEDYTYVAQRTTEPLENQANKARQSEGKQYVSSLNKSQQAYFTEYGRFTSSIQESRVSIKTETENYSYRINLLSETAVQPTATAKIDGLKSYTGGVFAFKDKTGEQTTVSIVCESEQASRTAPSPPQLIGEDIQCASGSRPIN